MSFLNLAVGLKGGPKRKAELHLNPMQAVAAGRGTADDLFHEIAKRGGRSTDFQVVLVYPRGKD
jgi:hypothetical protein